MPDTKKLIELNVTLVFDGQGKTFSWYGNVSNDFTITVDARKAWILIALETTNLKPGQKPAIFLDEAPIEWMTGTTPAGMSSWVPTPGEGQRKLTIEDINMAVGHDMTFDFQVNILFEGEVITSTDPTILNKDIGGLRPEDKP